jgi:uncharacterized protein involved in cysteine biosynthesis
MLTSAILKTLRQMPTRAMLRPLLIGLVVTALCIVALGATVGAAAGWLVSGVSIPWVGEIGGAADDALGWLAGIGSVVAMAFAFTPAAAAAIGFFVDPVADAVEARYYPDLPPAKGRSLGTEVAMGLRYAGLAILLNIPLLPFYFLFPPLPAAVNGWLLGRSFFDMTALRRETPARTRALRRAAWFQMVPGGILLAVMTLVPFLNLLAPVFGLAMMTHLYHGARMKRGDA